MVQLKFIINFCKLFLRIPLGGSSYNGIICHFVFLLCASPAICLESASFCHALLICIKIVIIDLQMIPHPLLFVMKPS